MAARERRHEDYPGAAPELIRPAILVEFIICSRKVAEPTESAGLTAREARCATEAKGAMSSRARYRATVIGRMIAEQHWRTGLTPIEQTARISSRAAPPIARTDRSRS